MKTIKCMFGLLTAFLLLFNVTLVTSASAETRVTFGVTEPVVSYNPYGDSVALMYGVWCEVIGCLGTYDFRQGKYVGKLAERWEVDKTDPRRWIFYLRKNYKRSDGSIVVADDVVHSINRIKTDPQSKQGGIVRQITKVEALDRFTVRITTKKPFATLMVNLFDSVFITSKAIYDKYGPKVADRKYPIGAGPYKLKEIVLGSRLVLEKIPGHPDARSDTPDIVIYQLMKEPEQRITALLNDEIQIAQFVPPHLEKRISGSPKLKTVSHDALEIMFLAMSPKFKPWDNKLLRKAVAYAIDRDLIIKNMLRGQASRLDGPLGPGQYGYDPNLQPKYRYDPEKARGLVKRAGFPDGVDVDFYTPVGRYINDKQIAQAMTGMLNDVGIRAKLHTPEWSTLWANIQKGKIPFYYIGRGSVFDPGRALRQYFGTGGSKRIQYSNPQVDALLSEADQSFDENKRKAVLSKLMSVITDDAPAHFLWRHKMLFGTSKNVNYVPRPDGRVYINEDLRMRR